MSVSGAVMLSPEALSKLERTAATTRSCSMTCTTNTLHVFNAGSEEEHNKRCVQSEPVHEQAR